MTNNEKMNPKDNKEPKAIFHHTWASFIFKNFLALV